MSHYVIPLIIWIRQTGLIPHSQVYRPLEIRLWRIAIMHAVSDTKALLQWDKKYCQAQALMCRFPNLSRVLAGSGWLRVADHK